MLDLIHCQFNSTAGARLGTAVLVFIYIIICPHPAHPAEQHKTANRNEVCVSVCACHRCRLLVGSPKPTTVGTERYALAFRATPVPVWKSKCHHPPLVVVVVWVVVVRTQ